MPALRCPALEHMSNIEVTKTAQPRRQNPAARPGRVRRHAQGRPAGSRRARHARADRPARRHDREIDELVSRFALDHGGIPATLNYRGYRYSTCTSINHVVCHGMPNDKPLRQGDIVNIDVTLIVDGWHGDTSRMYPSGDVSRRAERLMHVTYESLMRGIAVVKPGNTTGDIGAAIQRFAEAERCSVVRDFCGHGLGRVFHDRPNILHYGEPGEGTVLKPGMLFTIEPMINLGKTAREDSGRRLDGRDARPRTLRAVRAHRRRHRDGLRDFYPFDEGPRLSGV